MKHRTYKSVEEIENAPFMDLIRHYGSWENLEKDIAVLRAQEIAKATVR